MIDRIWVSGFRNLSELKLQLDPISYVVGPNNQGKTNFLESICFGISGKAVSGGGTSDLRAFDRHGMGAVGLSISNGGLTLYRKIEAPNRPYLNRSCVTQAEVSRQVVVDYWSAEVIRSVQESPDIRRHAIHRYCALINPQFKSALKAYSRILTQRNAALKTQNMKAVALYSGPLVAAALAIVQSREKSLKDLSHAITQLLNGYEGYRFDLQVDQRCRHVQLVDYEESMNRYLTTHIAKECALGYTTVGPHRDDIHFLADGMDVVRYLSRGVNRLVAILLHLITFRLLRSDTGAGGVLALDDVFSEIATPLASDVLGDLVKDNQVVFASTDVSPYQGRFSGSVFKVSRGLLEKVT